MLYIYLQIRQILFYIFDNIFFLLENYDMRFVE